jgi:hypothetical protein
MAVSGGVKPTTVKDLTFLTRDGCVNTPDMMNNLDDALRTLGWRQGYRVINISKLSVDDPRTGYPTRRCSGKGRTSSGCPRPNRRTTRRVDAPTRAEFRPLTLSSPR